MSNPTQDSQSELREELESIAAQLGEEPSYAEKLLAKIEAYVTTRVKEAERLARIDGELNLLYKMKDSYGRGSVKLYDEPDNNHNNVYLDDRIKALTTTTNGKGE